MKDEEVDMLLGQIEDGATEGDHIDDGILYAYVRRRLEVGVASDVERHLIGCADCRALAEGLALEPAPALLAAGRRALERRRAPRRALLGALALAAGLLLFLALPRAPEALPTFALEGPFGGVRAVRSGETYSRTFDADSDLEVILRPSAPAPAVEVLVEVERRGGDRVPVRAGSSQASGAGTVVYRVPARRLFAAGPGTYAVRFSIVRDGAVVQQLALELEYVGDEP